VALPRDAKPADAFRQDRHILSVSAAPALPQAALELCAGLQASLDPQHLLNLTLAATTPLLPVVGLEFIPNNGDARPRAGNTARHVTSFDLVAERHPLGCLRVYHDQVFAQDQASLLEGLLSGLIYPMRNALSYLQAVELASHDPLTGVQNRRAMNQALVREVELAHRQQAQLSMLVIDVDDFKQFNDRFGHIFGDEVLRKLTDTTASTVRRSDLLYRFGGEEFVVLAAYTGIDDARLLAERIRERIEGIGTISDRPVQLTVSIGVSTLRANDSPKSLFERADRALYQAKRDGRNRVLTG